MMRGRAERFTTRRHAAYLCTHLEFSIGLDRGRKTDDFEAGIIEVEPPHVKARDREATQTRRGLPQSRRTSADQPTQVTRADEQPTHRGTKPARTRLKDDAR